MVGGAAGSKNLEMQVVRNADHVRIKPFLQFTWNQITALFCAEDAMHEIGDVCV